MYTASKQIVEKLEANIDTCGTEELNLLAQMKLSHTILEEADSEFLRRYTMEQGMFKSLSQDQINFICSQIGHWYVMWQDKMWVDDKPNQHWLGLAKEQLKTMICGD